MAEKKKNTPEIRFKEFEEEWICKKLKEFLETSNEKNIDNLFSKKDVLSVSGDYGIVNQIAFHGRSFAGVSVSNYGVVRNGYVVYTKSPLNSNPYGIIKTNKGCDGIVSTLYAIYKPKGVTYPSFVQCYFENNSRTNNYLRPLCNKGAKNDMKITADNALLGFVTFPKIEEQIKISDFFQHLDALISNRQKKLESLKKLKKSCLAKMFPQNGSKVPEIRFKGFEGEWETKRLGEICNITKGEQLNVKDMIKNGTYYVLNGGITPSGYTNSFNTDKNTISISEGGNSCGYVNFNKCEFWSGGHNYTIKYIVEIIQNEYLYHYLKSIEPYIMSKRVGSGLPNIQKTALQKIKVFYPSPSEQTIISNYFRNFDKMIDTKELEIEKLQNLKKACLDKMFA